MSMFPDKQWLLGGLKKLIRKIDDTGTFDRRLAPGSRRPRTARVADKFDNVADLVLSQDNAPKYPQNSATDCSSDRHLTDVS